MSTDFWAGYVSGAIGILVGNPLDIIKTKLQAGSTKHTSPTELPPTSPYSPTLPKRWTSLARGAAAPILGYGALNALLFVTYNRSLALLNNGNIDQEPPSALSIWTAGALGGLAIFFVSTPTELVKCRAQVSSPPRSSLQVTQELWASGGLRGLYMGGGITSVRDAVGYGFYFWSYELSKRAWANDADTSNQQAAKVLLCGGLAGVVTWASIFPLGTRDSFVALLQNAIKTRVQTWDLLPPPKSADTAANQPLLGSSTTTKNIVKDRPNTFTIAQAAYRAGGMAVFFRGLGICSVRAFIVNAVQWAVYEWMMNVLAT